MEKTHAQKSSHVQRGKTLRLLRKIHGWLGLWGALLGLLFGISGFLLNHRAVMKIPAVKMEETEIQLPVSAPLPENAKAFTKFIQTSLNIQHEPTKPKGGKGGKPEREATFMDKSIKQPEMFKIDFQLPQARIQAEYVVGNQFATIKREDANVWGFLTRMHKGVGANTGWVLLADSLAGAMLVLSITGVLLWTKMRGSRLAMAGLIGSSTFLLVWVTLLMM
ncbi:MAG TPA: PepSY-associated TM helix domain-containing protein [Methylotenera sp.]|nr:PepSY-associated TM helix domain-containing protein [Methylotenera sp.]